MIEPTHIVKPAGHETPITEDNNFIEWLEMFSNKDEAIDIWNSMFTKAPKQYTAEPVKGDL